MSNTIVKSNKYTMPKLSVKAQTIATIAAVAFSVLLPQLVHMLGNPNAYGSDLGTMLLPMYLPVMLVGFIAGPWAGLITGLIAPVLSNVLTGMPAYAILSYITVEIAAHGFISGAIRNMKLNIFVKVLLVQFGARAVSAAALLLATRVLNISALNEIIIISRVKLGVVGIILQLLLIPLIVYIVRKAMDNEASAN